jgi:hypothetical protein
MKRSYEIPEIGPQQIDVGSWVEIFEAYATAEGNEAIQVKSMRVKGKLYVFPGLKGRREGIGMRPHEGQITYIDRGAAGVRFGLRTA